MNSRLRHNHYYNTTESRSVIGQLPKLERVAKLHELAMHERVKGATELDRNMRCTFSCCTSSEPKPEDRSDWSSINHVGLPSTALRTRRRKGYHVIVSLNPVLLQ